MSSDLTDHSVAVDDGSTVTDYLPEERARGITITSAAVTFPWASHFINLIDTPGHADFTFEVARSLRVLDGAIAVLDAVAGVEAQTEKVWRQADEWNLSRLVYVNKMDRIGAGFGRTIRDISTRLKARPLVLQLPFFEHGIQDGAFQGVVDLVGLRVFRSSDSKLLAMDVKDLPHAEVRAEIDRARAAMLDTLAELDDEFLETYITNSEETKIPAPSIRKAIRSLTLRRSIVPVLCGASLRDIGVPPLLDAIIHYLPSPADLPSPTAEIISEGRKLASEQFPGQTCALAFKVIYDVVMGPLVFVRVYRGSIAKGMTLLNTRSGEKEKPTRLLRMYADESIDLERIEEGNIGVLLGTKSTVTGDTITSKRIGPLFQLQPIVSPHPVFIASIEPESLSEAKNVSDALQKLLREDPSLSVSVDEDSGQILLGGMGELHLEIAHKKLVQQFGAKCAMGKVRVSYRETLTSGVEFTVDQVYDREINGKPTRFGLAVTVSNVDLKVPNPPAKRHRQYWEYGNLIDIDLSQVHSLTNIDEEQAAEAIYAGSRAALQSTSSLQLPYHSVLVRVSNLQGFEKLTTFQSIFSASRLATQHALKRAISSNGPALMEPYMTLCITVPDAVAGDVIGDLTSSKGGLVLSFNSVDPPDFPDSRTPGDTYLPPDSTLSNSSAKSDHFVTISARVPLKEMIGYDKSLRGISQGRGTFIMSLEGFERMTGERASRVYRELTGEEI